MARGYGRAPRGQRLVGAVPHGHWKTTTFVAALGLGGMTAPLVIDGAMTGDLFEAYLERVLVPALAAGGVVVLYNLSSHKRARVRELIEGAGCVVLFLPPYSPDLNPIELANALLNALAAATIRCRVWLGQVSSVNCLGVSCGCHGWFAPRYLVGLHESEIENRTEPEGEERPDARPPGIGDAEFM